MVPILKTKQFVACPECNQHDFPIQHVIDTHRLKKHIISVGPWFCDHCGYGLMIDVTTVQGSLDVTTKAHKERRYKEWVIVDIPPQAEPIRLVCKSTRSQPTITEEHIGHMRFRYEENTALENIFHEVEDIQNDLKINPKLIKICATQDEADQIIYGSERG